MATPNLTQDARQMLLYFTKHFVIALEHERYDSWKEVTWIDIVIINYPLIG